MTSKVLVLGAPLDTHNLGVTALLTSAIAALEVSPRQSEYIVFDNGRGSRTGSVHVGDSSRPVRLLGARNSKRLTSPDSLYRIALEGERRHSTNAVIEAIRTVDVAVDISAGDSFSDIYGWKRYLQIVMQKVIVLRQRIPLVLLPQTIGPFASAAAERLAVQLLVRADIVLTRDEWSYEHLRSLLGERFDEQRHRVGVDLAFALPAAVPHVDPATRAFLSSGRPTAGVNVSGLLYNDENSASRFGLADDYRRTARLVIESLLRETDAQVLLVPHVVAPAGHPESDPQALIHLARCFGGDRRIHVAPTPAHPSAAKGLIAMTDWFAGSRMHATIAALSSGVPAAALAYSDKARGVFDTVASGDQVADLRSMTSVRAAKLMSESFASRAELGRRLAERLPAVRHLAAQQVTDAMSSVGD